MKPVVPREQANCEVDDAIEHPLKEGASPAAFGLVDTIEDACELLGHPAVGGARYAYELDLPGLRTWSLRRFPFLIFYVEMEDRVDVWRVLHNRRDIPASLQGLPDDRSYIKPCSSCLLHVWVAGQWRAPAVGPDTHPDRRLAGR